MSHAHARGSYYSDDYVFSKRRRLLHYSDSNSLNQKRIFLSQSTSSYASKAILGPQKDTLLIPSHSSSTVDTIVYSYMCIKISDFFRFNSKFFINFWRKTLPRFPLGLYGRILVEEQKLVQKVELQPKFAFLGV